MTTFARVTPTLSDVLWELPACAQRLHEWLLQQTRPGRPYEAFLEKFVERSGYSLRHAQRSLKTLVSQNIVEVAHRYSGKIYALIVHDERTFDFETKTKKAQSLTPMSETSTSMSETEGSKPHSAVTNNREEFRDNRDTQPLHPVKESEAKQESSLVTPKPSQSKAVLEPPSQILRQELENTLQQPLNKNILAALLQHSETRARDALDALRESMIRTNVENPAGWFITAIRKGYKPNHTRSSQATTLPQPVTVPEPAPEPTKSELPPGFPEWRKWAFPAGVALASEQQPNGEIIIHTKDGPEPFEQVQQTWPIEKLKQMAEGSYAPVQPRSFGAWRSQSPEPVVPVPSDAAVNSPERRSNALARLQAKFAMLGQRKREAIAEAKHWGFEVTGAGIFEVAF